MSQRPSLDQRINEMLSEGEGETTEEQQLVQAATTASGAQTAQPAAPTVPAAVGQQHAVQHQPPLPPVHQVPPPPPPHPQPSQGVQQQQFLTPAITVRTTGPAPPPAAPYLQPVGMSNFPFC